MICLSVYTSYNIRVKKKSQEVENTDDRGNNKSTGHWP